MQLRRVNRQQAATSISRPSPVLGWNPRSPLQAMQPGEAIQMDNWFPDAGFCITRPGQTAHATGVGSGLVKSVFPWTGPAGQKLLAAGGGEIYDASSAGAASVITSTAAYSSDEWQTVNYGGNVTGVNGTDTPWFYNGSTIADTTWTGVTQTTLINATAYKDRIYFCEVDSASFWYSNTSNITGGTLAEFDLSQIASLGGYLVAQGTWSTSKGNALQALLVSVMSTGEVIVYSGDDPGSNFSIVGRYRTGRPIGRRCLVNIGGDLIILTNSGVIPVSLLLTVGESDAVEANPVWGKIRPAIRDAAILYESNGGWDSYLCPQGCFAIWNVPTTATTFEQIVLNPLTGGWCRYTGNPAYSWGSVSGVTYFGSTSGRVIAHTGNSDLGISINATARTAFDYVSRPGNRKHITAVRPAITANGSVMGTVGIVMDFSTRSFPANLSTFGEAGSQTPWGSPWGSPWGKQSDVQLDWYSVGGYGRTFSTYLQTITSSNRPQWTATDFLGQLGAAR